MPGRRRKPRLSEPVDLLAADDPVAAFRSAHHHGRRVRLPTSGSTSLPRYVVRSTTSWVDSFEVVSRLAGLHAGARVWVPGPAAGSMNLFARVHTAFTGARLVGTPRDASHAVLTPAGLDALVAGAVDPGLVAVVAGDRLSAERHDRARAAGLAVHHYYGAAELSFVAWGAHEDDLRVFPGVDAQVRDGEIWVRSPYLAEGYDGQPGPLRRDASGFATVGDRGRLDGDLLHVDGRPEAVTTAGATVQVADVERELRPAARGEVVVVSVPHDRLGAVLAAVLTDEGDRAALTAVARERLSPAARPRLWRHLPRLPLTIGGKVDRAALTRLVEVSPDERDAGPP